MEIIDVLPVDAPNLDFIADYINGVENDSNEEEPEEEEEEEKEEEEEEEEEDTSGPSSPPRDDHHTSSVEEYEGVAPSLVTYAVRGEVQYNSLL